MRVPPALRVLGGFALSFILPAILPAAQAGGEPSDWTFRNERVEHALKAGAPVCITNLVGDVRVREVADPVLTVISMIQQHRDDGRKPLLHTGAGTPCIVDASFPGTAPEGLYPAGRAPRVDLTIFVPPGSPVFITTAVGRIDAKSLSGDVTARSDTGRIAIRTPGLINVWSRCGDVEAIIKKLGSGRTFRLESEAGSICVRLPSEGAACVTAETTRHIASDFSMSIRRAAVSDRKHATIQIGTSRLGRWLFGWATRRTEVQLKSEQGDIQVLAPFPKMEEP